MNTDLAKRWTALRGWRWMRGMSAMPPQDGCADHRYIVSRLCGPDRYPVWEPFISSVGLGTLHLTGLPDLDDPATIGCLLALAREITGCRLTVADIDPANGIAEASVVLDSPDGDESYQHGASIPEALLLACEAAEAAKGEK